MPKPTQVVAAAEKPAKATPAAPAHAASGAAVESVSRKARRRFSASEKLRILKAAEDALATGKLGAVEALLRKEGIYSSHLSAWRKQRDARGSAGMAPLSPGRKPKHDARDLRLIAVTKENAALKRKLQLATALLELQKKAHELLGIALPEPEGRS